MEIKKKNVFLSEESRMLDSYSMEKKGIPGKILMGMAGASVWQRIRKITKGYKIIIFSGSGNNGGDGFVLAHLAAEEGRDVSLFFKEGKTGSEECLFYRNLALSNPDIHSFPITESLERPEFRGEKTAVLDCILGTGFRNPLSIELLDLFTRIGRLKKQVRKMKVIGIDTSSGFDGGRNFPLPPDIICEIGVKKLENIYASVLCRKIFFIPIGFPVKEFVSENTEKKKIFEGNFLKKKEILKISRRKNDSDKYKNGAASFIGGSAEMEGAVFLSEKAFRAMGGGISKIFSPACSGDWIHFHPNLMFSGISEKMTEDSFFIKSKAAVIGPGLKAEDFPLSKINIKSLIDNSEKFFVLDAGSADIFRNERLNSRCIFTPHLGELQRLADRKFDSHMQASLFLPELSEKLNCPVLLKGAVSVYCSAERELHYFNSPNPRLAAMGTGDIFSGLLAFFLSRTGDMNFSVQASVSVFRQTEKIRKKSTDASDILKFIEENF